MARAWERWDEVVTFTAPDAWVFRVAFNLLNSRFRRRAAERRAYERVAARPLIASADLDQAEILNLRAGVAALPPRQRQVAP